MLNLNGTSRTGQENYRSGILNKQTNFAYFSEQRTSFSVVLGEVRVIVSVPV